MRSFQALVLGCLLFAANLTAAPTFHNYIAAVVNDAVITRLAVERYVEKSLDLLRRTYYNQPDVFRRKANEAYDEALQQLLERELILHEFKESGGVIPETILDDEVRGQVRDRFGGDRVALIKTLQAESITYETYRTRIKEDLILRYMNQQNVNTGSIVSPAKVEAYYRDHLDEFQLDEQVKLRTIVLSRAPGLSAQATKALASEVLSKIKEGASFSEMAGIYSEGSQRQKNGDWGWVERSQLKKGLADIAFSLKPGQPSGIIGVTTDLDSSYWIYRYDSKGQLTRTTHYSTKEELLEDNQATPDGAPLSAILPVEEFYLLLVEERRPGRTRTLEEAHEEIERDLRVREREENRQSWIEKLKEKSFVRYF